jgi:hypothetical protein
MSLLMRARRPRARRCTLLFGLSAALAFGAPAGADMPGGDAMDPAGHWRPMLDHHMGADMPDLATATRHQRAVARRLMRRVLRLRARYPTLARARRAGYLPAGRWSSHGIRHFNSAPAESDGRALDPGHPESLLFWRGPDGRRRLAAVMFRAPSDRPPPLHHNPLLRWHAHYVCRHPMRGAPRQMPFEHCPKGEVARYGTTQMLHVWLTGDLETAYAMAPPLHALAAAFGLH